MLWFLAAGKESPSGQTQQAVVLHAIADLKIAYAEEVKELKKLNQMLALQESPDLILRDINLPLFDGFHICREIRKQSEVPIIVVTSRSADVDELMSMNLGADDFVTKCVIWIWNLWQFIWHLMEKIYQNKLIYTKKTSFHNAAGMPINRHKRWIFKELSEMIKVLFICHGRLCHIF